MTVAEAIKILQAMPDKKLKLMVDCPHCGKGNQLANIGMSRRKSQVVVDEIHRGYCYRDGYSFCVQIRERHLPSKCPVCGRGNVVEWPMGEEPTVRNCRVCGAETAIYVSAHVEQLREKYQQSQELLNEALRERITTERDRGQR